MANIKIASWNVYFSHKLVQGSSGNFSIPGKEKTRAERVAQIIKDIDPDLIAIIECMPRAKLNYFCRQYLDGYVTVLEGNKNRLNIGMLYKSGTIEISKIAFDKNKWKDRLGNDKKQKLYKWSRIPLIVKVKHKGSGKEFIVAAIHPKSKKTYSDDPVKREEEALTNRKRIVAEGRRIHSMLWSFAEKKVRRLISLS